LYDAENAMKKTGVRGWKKKINGDRDAWKLIVKDTRILHGPYGWWRREVALWQISD
jgi:hypothetical protein